MAHEASRPPWLSAWPWHRWLGVVATAAMVWVAATGIVVAHSDDLGLPHEQVRQGWILDLWGIPQARVGAGFPTRVGWVVEADGVLVVGGRALRLDIGELRGAADLPRGVIVAGTRALALLGADAALIEKVEPPLAGGESVSWLAADADRIRVGTGARVLVADLELLGWSESAPGMARAAAVASALPAADAARAATAARAQALDWDRVLRDLHAWRIAGRWGVALADATAIAIIVLSITGLVMFVQRRRSQRALAQEA